MYICFSICQTANISAEITQSRNVEDIQERQSHCVVSLAISPWRLFGSTEVMDIFKQCTFRQNMYVYNCMNWNPQQQAFIVLWKVNHLFNQALFLLEWVKWSLFLQLYTHTLTVLKNLENTIGFYSINKVWPSFQPVKNFELLLSLILDRTYLEDNIWNPVSILWTTDPWPVFRRNIHYSFLF